MKRYGLHFKNIAAVLMLVALASLLLPFCKVTTSGTTTKISGIGLIKIGADLGVEYAKNGTIENEYKLTDHLTWGDVKLAAEYASKQHQTRQIALGGAALLLPMGLIFLALILTLFATGKISMILPTLFTLFAVMENALLIGAFPIVQRQLLGESGVKIGFLIGIYAFTILCAVALAILIMVWVTGGFNPPEGQEREASQGKSKKKSRFSRDGKRRKKRRRRKKGSRKAKKRDTGDTSGQKTNKQQISRNENEKPEAKKPESTFAAARGQVNGLAGIYQGTSLDLTQAENSMITIGTTPEARAIIENGTLSEAYKLEGCNCILTYDAAGGKYTITSHSAMDMMLQTGESRSQIRLRQGETTTVGGNTLLFLGDFNNIIKLD